MKMLITGGSGFVGRNLVSTFQLNNSYELLPISLRNGLSSNVPSAEAYIHLAGKAHDLKNTSEEKEYFEVNYELTKSLFDTFLKDPQANTFIFVSSVKAVRDTVEGYLTEAMQCEPKTAYGKSKRLAEEYILKSLPANKQVYILRPCMIHGPQNKGNLNLLYALISKNIPWPLGAFDNKRSFCSIDNLLFTIQNILDRNDIPSGIYHVADNEALSTNEVIKLMADSLGKKARIWNLPQGLIDPIAKLGDFLPLPLNSERLQKLTESYLVSNQKLKKALDKPLPFTSREGLKKTFDSFKKVQ